MRRRRRLIASSVLIASSTVSVTSAQGLVIVDYAKLNRHWHAEPELVMMDVGNSRETAFGCVTVGFMIDRGGRMTAVRPLRRAFGKHVPPQRARELTIAVTNAAPMIARYTKASENPNTTEVFTALTIPVLGRKISNGMPDPQKEAVAAQLRPSCEISDLAAWVDGHDMGKQPEIEVAPEIDSAKTADAL